MYLPTAEPPFSGGRAGRGGNKPSGELPDCISAKLLKQLSVAGRRCVTYVNSWPLVRGIVSVQYQVLTPLVRARRPSPARPREGVRPGEGRRARRLAGGEGGRGKAAGGGGKARGQTVVNSGSVSDE